MKFLNFVLKILTGITVTIEIPETVGPIMILSLFDCGNNTIVFDSEWFGSDGFADNGKNWENGKSGHSTFNRETATAVFSSVSVVASLGSGHLVVWSHLGLRVTSLVFYWLSELGSWSYPETLKLPRDWLLTLGLMLPIIGLRLLIGWFVSIDWLLIWFSIMGRGVEWLLFGDIWRFHFVSFLN